MDKSVRDGGYFYYRQDNFLASKCHAAFCSKGDYFCGWIVLCLTPALLPPCIVGFFPNGGYSLTGGGCCQCCHYVYFTGTGESVPSGQVTCLWMETDIVFFSLCRDVMVMAEETIEAAVLLEEVFTGCSERTAFLASGNKIP